MADEPNDPFVERLLLRREELLRRYLSHREEAATRIVDAPKYDPSTLAFFAAGEAAMEQAFCDGIVDVKQHAWLAAFHVAFLGVTADDFCQCQCRFEVKPPATSPPGAVISREEYLNAFAQSQDEVARSRGTIEGSYKALRQLHAEDPYRLVNAALLFFAGWKGRVDRHTFFFLERYFAVMYRFVEAEEFGLPEIADKLGRAIDPDSWN